MGFKEKKKKNSVLMEFWEVTMMISPFYVVDV